MPPQFDTLLDTLTVREMLMYTADLKSSHREAKADKVARVDDLIQKLNLEVGEVQDGWCFRSALVSWHTYIVRGGTWKAARR